MSHAPSVPPVRRHDDLDFDLGALQPGPLVEFYKIDPVVRYLWSLGKIIFWGIVFGIIFLVGLTASISGGVSLGFMIGLPVLAFLAVLHILWSFISYPKWGYALRRTDFLLKSGVIWKNVTAVPFARIQHVDSNAGPLERWFGVANLVIHTAGSQMGSIVVPGLPAQRAEDLRDYLSEVGHTHANL